MSFSSFKLKVYRGIFKKFVIYGIIPAYLFHVKREADTGLLQKMEHIKQEKVP